MVEVEELAAVGDADAAVGAAVVRLLPVAPPDPGLGFLLCPTQKGDLLGTPVP